jgi:superfamily II DNA or RNA helicase
LKNAPHRVLIGDLVRVRRERWRVVGVRLETGGYRVVALTGTGRTNAGVRRVVIAPFDRVEPAEHAGGVRVVSMAAWRTACAGLFNEQGAQHSAGGLHTAAAARMDLHPHQLEPALAIGRGLASRVLIADEVGLGKTIQAGLVISELRARCAADRVLVIAPAGLRTQWARELNERFGLEPAVMDAREGRRRAALLPAGVNPWTTMPIAIASMDYVKRPEVLAAVALCHWDVVVIDEAHGVSGGTDRRQAAAALCERAAYVLLLTATPHNGDPAAFRSLCGIGAVDDDPLLIFRRTRAEMPAAPTRRIHRLRVRQTADERAAHDALAEVARIAQGEPANHDARLACSVLYKRAFSSAHALARTAARRLAALSGESDPDLSQQPLLPLYCDKGGEDDGDASDDAPRLFAPLVADAATERALLEDVHAAARAAATADSKLRVLRRLLSRLDALGERAIVFTEYRDTLAHVHASLGRPAVLIHGGLTIEERNAAVNTFVSGAATLLLATDAAGEGLNLQGSCRVVVNLELPWNPMRLEQRIGRVDRIGQTRTVHVFHLIAAQAGEAAVLGRLEGRVMRAAEDVGAADPLGLLQTLEETTQPPAFPGFRLVAEAQEERAHAIQARAGSARRSGATDSGVPSRMLLAVGRRRRRLRAALAGRSVAIFRAALAEPGGRPTAVRLACTSFATAWVHPRTKGWADGVGLAIERLVPGEVDPHLDAWRASNAHVHHEFWNRRIARERAIASTEARAPALRQPGLFDRRSEQQAVADEVAAAAQGTARRDRIADAERARDVCLDGPRPVLVLLN